MIGLHYIYVRPIHKLTNSLAQFFVDKVNGVRAATENAASPTFATRAGQRLSVFAKSVSTTCGEFYSTRHPKPVLLTHYRRPCCVRW